MRENIRIGLQYVAAWLGGCGAVLLSKLMEDAATAEIGLTQLWQRLRFEGPLDDGRRVTRALFEASLAVEMEALPPSPRLAEARNLLVSLVLADAPEDFLAVPAYATLRRSTRPRDGYRRRMVPLR